MDEEKLGGKRLISGKTFDPYNFIFYFFGTYLLTLLFSSKAILASQKLEGKCYVKIPEFCSAPFWYVLRGCCSKIHSH
jgi:hypothetical protein